MDVRIKRVYLALCCCAFLFLASCDPGPGSKKFNVGFSQCTGADAWRRQMIASMRGELAFYPNMTLAYKDAGNSNEQQIKDIEAFINAGVDLLIVSPNEADPITPVVEKAFRKGIPVIIVDRKTSSSLYTAYIGANNYEIGKLAGSYMAEKLNGKGKILEVWGLRGSSPAIDRHRGFIEMISAYPDISVVAEIDGRWEQDTATAELRRKIKDIPPFDLVFAHNDVMAYGAYRVCRETFGDNPIQFIGIDALPGPGAGIQFVDDKILTATFLYPTGGEEAIRLASQILNGQPFEKENVLHSTVVDAKNVRVMKLQTDRILTQQRDIVRQQEKINEQIQVYYNQRVLIYVLLASLMAAIIAGAVAALSWREKNEINKRLEAKSREILDQRNTIAAMAEKAEVATQEKLKFFTNISHEFKTPLTLILGPIEELLAKGADHKSAAARDHIVMIKKNAVRLLRLVNQLMDFRKIEDKKMMLRASETDVIQFLNEVMTAFGKVAQKRKIDFRLITDLPQLYVWFDPDMLDKVIFNLLSNAFKFTHDKGRIHLTVSLDAAGKNVMIWVEDNGQGMSAGHAAHAFDRFYTGENVQGTGIGLSLSKELIELHHGTLALTSEKGKGTRFCVTLPLGNAHFDEREIIQVRTDWVRNAHDDMLNEDIGVASATETETVTVHHDHTVLLIDDNAELRQFIKSRLASRYTVVEAHDGVTGLHLAFEVVPDVIICDVMLPGKDGLDITRTLKSDLRTSHIPAIILTARGAIEQRIAGVQTGADEYITKPFVMEYLLERIKALIRNREMLKEHYSQQLNIEPLSPVAGGLDKKFVNDFAALIEKNISNADLNANDIGRELGMSRVQVYRKVKALLGYSVNDYIVNVRLKKAKHLLLQTDKTIAEISTEVGFSSPTYFSTTFKSKFNVSPKEFKGQSSMLG